MAGLYPTYIDGLTLGNGGNTVIAASGYPTTHTEFIAHPSNSGVLYIKNVTTNGMGFPLNPGERLVLERPDLKDYTVSGVSGQRVVWAAFKS